MLTKKNFLFIVFLISNNAFAGIIIPEEELHAARTIFLQATKINDLNSILDEKNKALQSLDTTIQQTQAITQQIAKECEESLLIMGNKRMGITLEKIKKRNLIENAMYAELQRFFDKTNPTLSQKLKEASACCRYNIPAFIQQWYKDRLKSYYKTWDHPELKKELKNLLLQVTIEDQKLSEARQIALKTEDIVVAETKKKYQSQIDKAYQDLEKKAGLEKIEEEEDAIHYFLPQNEQDLKELKDERTALIQCYDEHFRTPSFRSLELELLVQAFKELNQPAASSSSY